MSHEVLITKRQFLFANPQTWTSDVRNLKVSIHLSYYETESPQLIQIPPYVASTDSTNTIFPPNQK